MEAGYEALAVPEDAKLAEVVRLSILFDFYGELLGGRNKQIFEDYVLNDLSLGEIAKNSGMSRQGVYDTVKRCSVKLTEYEDKLHLAEKFNQTKQMVNEIKKLAVQMKQTGSLEGLDQLTRTADKILKDW